MMDTVARSLVRGRVLRYGGAAAIVLLLPLLLSPYALIVLSDALVFALACLGLNLLLGHTGLLSLGHSAYFGIAAYTGGFMYALTPINSLEVFLLSGLLAAAALSAIFGFLCVRATKIHFTILTLAFTQLLHSLFISGIIFRPFGGVGRGLFLLGGGGLYIPRVRILGAELAPEVFNRAFYYVIVIVFFVCIFLMWRIVNAPFGKALRAIRDNETRAQFIGIPVRKYRWYAFIIAGTFTGIAGGLFAMSSRQVTPEQLHWMFSAKLVLATVLGGTRQFVGPVVGAFAFVAIQELALRFTRFHSLVLGVILIVFVMACPGGLLGGGASLINTVRRRDNLWGMK